MVVHKFFMVPKEINYPGILIITGGRKGTPVHTAAGFMHGIQFTCSGDILWYKLIKMEHLLHNIYGMAVITHMQTEYCVLCQTIASLCILAVVVWFRKRWFAGYFTLNRVNYSHV